MGWFRGIVQYCRSIGNKTTQGGHNMKVTVNGDVQIEYAPEEQDQAIDLIQSLRQLEAMNPEEEVFILNLTTDDVQLFTGPESTGPESSNGQPEGGIFSLADLTPAQTETYDCLVDFDHPDGVSVSMVSDTLEINPSAAGARLRQLCGIGYAKRVSRGRYRAVIK